MIPRLRNIFLPYPQHPQYIFLHEIKPILCFKERHNYKLNFLMKIIHFKNTCGQPTNIMCYVCREILIVSLINLD